MHTAATDGMDASVGSGRTALAHIATTLPGVSEPSRVVRSMHRMAKFSAQSFDSRFIERLASDAARSSIPTASTEATLPSSEVIEAGEAADERSISVAMRSPMVVPGRSATAAQLGMSAGRTFSYDTDPGCPPPRDLTPGCLQQQL